MASPGRTPGPRSNQSCSCQPTPQPRQHQIQAPSETYAVAYGNTRSSTHPARPEIQSTFSQRPQDLNVLNHNKNTYSNLLMYRILGFLGKTHMFWLLPYLFRKVHQCCLRGCFLGLSPQYVHLMKHKPQLLGFFFFQSMVQRTCFHSLLLAND